jgi:hypothetical protein
MKITKTAAIKIHNKIKPIMIPKISDAVTSTNHTVPNHNNFTTAPAAGKHNKKVQKHHHVTQHHL